MIEVVLYAFLTGEILSNVPVFNVNNYLKTVAETTIPYKKKLKQRPRKLELKLKKRFHRIILT